MKQYEKDKPIETISELLSQRLVYVNGYIRHISFFKSWQLWLIESSINGKRMYTVKKIEHNATH